MGIFTEALQPVMLGGDARPRCEGLSKCPRGHRILVPGRAGGAKALSCWGVGREGLT